MDDTKDIDHIPAIDRSVPVFDIAADDLPFSDEDPLPLDDDGNILPGGDEIDDDPNDNGDTDPDDMTDLPTGLPSNEIVSPTVPDYP